ncbi:glycosyltransferase [Methylocaldum sp.]|uniref:glycosyltransferase n=1 Tax=Methylocaldum sp. TaxID=1969727 RepID=UPI002D4F3882|nr:glycosyltransferase [Methylocaldum sp.]HYE35028.1 glycosyltransferase [Methylocaldum sp.]
MRITMVCNELPFPPGHGGLVDVWRRLCAMKSAGVRIHLVCWGGGTAGTPQPEHLGKVREVVEELHVFPFERNWPSRIERMVRLWRLPWRVASRTLTPDAFRSLLDAQRAFGSRAVWLDAPYGGEVARRLARELRAPLLYRSHNIEHQYTRHQARIARTVRERVRWALSLINLNRYERGILNESSAFFDISVDDLAHWKKLGFMSGHWLPPLVDEVFAERLSAPREASPRFDVGYLGNLFMPNNVEGLVWFLEKVAPRLLDARPGLCLFVAGSHPSDRIRAALAARPEVTLIENPPEAVSILRDAQVLINPVFAGSGVNVKSVEMLFSPAELISTPQGLAGLPDEVKRCFRISQDESGFASAILDGLRAPPVGSASGSESRAAARSYFRAKRIDEILPILFR